MERQPRTVCTGKVEMSRSWFLISYDVRDPTRLAKAARLLKGYGNRVQYSVFRCFLSQRNLEKLRWEMSKILTDEDDLLIIELCKACVRKIRMRGGEDIWPEDPPTFEII